MSKVITFSTKFPAYHLYKGEATFFVEKLLRSFPGWEEIISNQSKTDIVNDFALAACEPKYHTIRGGNRWKVGDKFSPRIWSGKPYASPMIKITDDIEIKKIWDISIHHAHNWFAIFINGQECEPASWETLAMNDGLTVEEMMEWFKQNNIFTGQIICWNETIEY